MSVYLFIGLLSFQTFVSCAHTRQLVESKVSYQPIASIESDASDNGEGSSVSIEGMPRACDNYNYQLFQRTQERLKHPSLIERLIDQACKWLFILLFPCSMFLVLYNKGGGLSFDTTPSNSSSSVPTILRSSVLRESKLPLPNKALGDNDNSVILAEKLPPYEATLKSAERNPLFKSKRTMSPSNAAGIAGYY